MIADEYQIK